MSPSEIFLLPREWWRLFKFTYTNTYRNQTDSDLRDELTEYVFFPRSAMVFYGIDRNGSKGSGWLMAGLLGR